MKEILKEFFKEYIKDNLNFILEYWFVFIPAAFIVVIGIFILRCIIKQIEETWI